jgi:hypothetical protein
MRVVSLSDDYPRPTHPQDQLGSSKFMKTYKCKVDGVPVVVKIYLKRDPEEVSRGLWVLVM